MSKKTLQITDALYDYLLSVSLREPDVLRELRDETNTMEKANMQISPEQGQFMALLIELIGAKKTLEIGVFTGYSSLCTALALPPDGKVVGCDVSEEWTAIAKRYWEKAGVSHKIDLRLAPAIETLDQMINAGESGTFDFAFIDAEKTEYEDYYQRTWKLLRSGGLIAIDNVLRSGRVIDPDFDDEDTNAIRDFNLARFNDKSVPLSLVPIADGLTLIRKP
ncbi:class I SAM-dependent methyltransferase [Candidatus Nitrosacidococcus sp. I8]|uniref:class I SAM-dependent methyltransferase n=1 Tax=Candidatus Nitrosacidococcus sp. I8 TaxID=2942908 RepID=UPI0022264FAC|nr:class I SAM-dependent methyltransferase [Candidatus Nitrosacidococcus sp. I8]CAH9018542.1 tRNA 5-hydroxyuridine methyltransferase [Candidatus Nitrosacidococcus sp. I8]